jgi:hypothetical protein
MDPSCFLRVIQTRKGEKAMSKHERDDHKDLPKPVALTPQEVQHVAAAAAVALVQLPYRPFPGPLGGPPPPTVY